MRSTDYDEKIKRAEENLKKWKAEKRKLATKEAKAAQREAERQRDEELRQKGHEYEDLVVWMMSRSMNRNGIQMTVWEWYQRDTGVHGN